MANGVGEFERFVRHFTLTLQPNPNVHISKIMWQRSTQTRSSRLHTNQCNHACEALLLLILLLKFL